MQLFFNNIITLYYTSLNFLWFKSFSAHFLVCCGVKTKPPETCSVDAVLKRAELVASKSAMWPNGSEYNNIWIMIPPQTCLKVTSTGIKH